MPVFNGALVAVVLGQIRKGARVSYLTRAALQEKVAVAIAVAAELPQLAQLLLLFLLLLWPLHGHVTEDRPSRGRSKTASRGLMDY